MKNFLYLFCIAALMLILLSCSGQTAEQEKTPEPTPTVEVPTPNPTKEPMSELDFLTEVASDGNYCSVVADELEDLMNRINDNSDLLVDKQYMQDFFTKIDEFENACANFCAENPPQKYIDVNNLLCEADSNFGQGATDLRTGIENLDVEVINKADEYFGIGGQKLTEAASLLEQIKNTAE